MNPLVELYMNVFFLSFKLLNILQYCTIFCCTVSTITINLINIDTKPIRKHVQLRNLCCAKVVIEYFDYSQKLL